ncbi:MAG: hypothetical protein R3Y24_11135 [Eubacteriales bacterium]
MKKFEECNQGSLLEAKYNQGNLIEAKCNQCGKSLLVEQGILKEGCFDIRFQFGYFGNRDGEIHSFDLCETCYNQMIAHFQIPVTIEEAVEFM